MLSGDEVFVEIVRGATGPRRAILGARAGDEFVSRINLRLTATSAGSLTAGPAASVRKVRLVRRAGLLKSNIKLECAWLCNEGGVVSLGTRLEMIPPPTCLLRFFAITTVESLPDTHFRRRLGPRERAGLSTQAFMRQARAGRPVIAWSEWRARANLFFAAREKIEQARKTKPKNRLDGGRRSVEWRKCSRDGGESSE